MKRRLIIDLDYEPNNATEDDIDLLLDMVATGLQVHGLYTGHTDATVKTVSFLIQKNPRSQRFPVGHQFLTPGKHPRVNTITDCHTITNRAGEVIKLEYVATHQFAGQTVTDCHVAETTIARNPLPAQTS